MTNEEAVKMLEAKLECMRRDVSGIDDECNRKLCDECHLCYDQGNMGEQQEYLRMSIGSLKQESVIDKIRAEIAEYGSIWVAYVITGHSDRDIENLIDGVLKQAKEQVLEIIDKYRQEE